MIAVSMMRDEADICASTVALLVDQGAMVIVLDNLSTDATAELCRDAGAVVLPDPEPGYYQADKINALVREHAAPGEWVIPFDADEHWHGIASLQGCPVDVVTVPVYSMHPREHREPVMSASPEQMPVVAYRYHPDAWLHQGAHSVTHPRTPWFRGAHTPDELLVLHYQYRSREQLARKVRQGKAAYDATTLPYSEGQHWRDMGAMTDGQLDDLWADLCSRT